MVKYQLVCDTVLHKQAVSDRTLSMIRVKLKQISIKVTKKVLIENPKAITKPY